MFLRIQVIIGTMSVFILILVFELIRRRRLKEEYSLLWLLTGIVILIFSVFPELLKTIANLLGAYYLTTLFLISFIFLLLIVLHFSTILSQTTDRNKELAQELSILNLRLGELDNKYQGLSERTGINER